MKILILANFDVGLYKFRKELIQELIHQGNEVYISLPDGDLVRKVEAFGCKFIDTAVDRRGINPKTDIKLLTTYYKMVKKVKPDMVITYTIKPNIYGGMVCRFLKVPYAVNITGLGTAFQKDGLLKKIVIALYKLALKRAKVVFFENEGNKQELLQYGIVKEKQTCVLHGAGVNLEEYPYCEYPTEDTIRFLFIGRVMKEKGVDELFAAAERVNAESINVAFDIVGPMEDDYKERIDDLVKRNIIEYHGYREDVRPFIEKCHCFVLPSYHEGMANTLLEAGAMGRPLITSDIPGCREAVVEDITGFLCEICDFDSLYQKLKCFQDVPFEQRKIMSMQSRRHIEKYFDKKMIVKETIKSLF